MSVGGGEGDDAVDVTYSTKPNNTGGVLLGTATITNTINEQSSQGVQQGMGAGVITQITKSTQSGNIMCVGGGSGGDAVDVTYSTKPDNNVVVGMPTYNTITTEYSARSGSSSGQRIQTAGSFMGVGGGVGDNAVDVTYSTKPDNNIALRGQMVTKTTTTTTTTNSNAGFGLGYGQVVEKTEMSTNDGSVMGVGGGVHDEAAE